MSSNLIDKAGNGREFWMPDSKRIGSYLEAQRLLVPKGEKKGWKGTVYIMALRRIRLSDGEGNGNPLQCSCLENPRDGGAWWAAIYGVAQSWTRLKQLSIIIQLSLSVISDSLWPHGLQHARPPCPSPTPRAYSNSCPLSWWCHPTISSSVVLFSSCPQSFPASGSFQMSQSVQSLSRVQLFVTPWTAARQASLSITNSWSLLKLMSIELVMPSNHPILCHPLVFPPSMSC